MNVFRSLSRDKIIWKKRNKNCEFTSGSCWLLMSEKKDFLYQDRFSIFGCTMGNLIRCLVVSFNFFAGCDNFRIMAGKVQEGWEKVPDAGSQVLRCSTRLIDWLIRFRNRLFTQLWHSSLRMINFRCCKRTVVSQTCRQRSEQPWNSLFLV